MWEKRNQEVNLDMTSKMPSWSLHLINILTVMVRFHFYSFHWFFLFPLLCKTPSCILFPYLWIHTIYTNDAYSNKVHLCLSLFSITLWSCSCVLKFRIRVGCKNKEFVAKAKSWVHYPKGTHAHVKVWQGASSHSNPQNFNSTISSRTKNKNMLPILHANFFFQKIYICECMYVCKFFDKKPRWPIPVKLSIIQWVHIEYSHSTQYIIPLVLYIYVGYMFSFAIECKRCSCIIWILKNKFQHWILMQNNK